MALRVDLLLKITKVAITIVTKRHCIPVAQIQRIEVGQGQKVINQLLTN